MIVAISGPVGIGKSALVRKLAEATGSHLPSDCLENAFHEHFLENPQRWAFQFLNAHMTRHFDRWVQNRNRSLSGQKFLFEGFLHEEDRYIRAAHAAGILTTLEFEALLASYRAYTMAVTKPDLIVSLNVPSYRLASRREGRLHERQLGPGYLKYHDAAYDPWVTQHSDGMNLVRVDWTDFGNFNAVLEAVRT